MGSDYDIINKAEEIVLDFLLGDERLPENLDEPTESLDSLLEAARNYKMSPEEIREQRRSFAYGNAALANPFITREDIDRADEEIKREKGGNSRWD